LVVDHFNKQFELGDFRRSTLVESISEKEHILNMLTKGDYMYLTKIIEKKNPSNQTATLEAFIFSIPQNELIVRKKIPTKYISESYYQ